MEIVNVPVPVDRLQEVYAVLGRPKAQPQVDPTKDSNASGQLPLEDASAEDTPHTETPAPWTKAALHALWHGYEDGNAVRNALSYLADHPEEWIPSDELLDGIGLTDGKALGGALGALQRRSRNSFKRESPIEGRYIAGTKHYWLSDDFAEAIRDARERR